MTVFRVPRQRPGDTRESTGTERDPGRDTYSTRVGSADDSQPVDVVPPSGFDANPGGSARGPTVRMDVGAALQSLCNECGAPNRASGVVMHLAFESLADDAIVVVVERGASLDAVTKDVRRALVADALRRERGNLAAAARRLGMKYSTFYALAQRINNVQPDEGA